jgi:YVTN family beta-propeller protein
VKRLRNPSILSILLTLLILTVLLVGLSCELTHPLLYRLVTLLEDAQRTVSELLTTAPTPAHPAYAVSGGRPYALEIIDTDTRQIVKRIPLSDFPGPSVAIAPNGKVYVPILGGPYGARNTVAVYTPGAHSAKEIRVGIDPWAAVASPNGMVYVINMERGRHGTLSVIDSKNDQVVETIDIGLIPEAMAISGDGRWIYVARHDPYYLYGKPFGFDPRPRPDEPPPAPATIAVVDTQEARVVRIVGFEEGSFSRALIWTKDKLYWSLRSSQVKPDPKVTAGVMPGNKVIVLDAKTLNVLARIEVPPRPDRMALAPNGKLYVAHAIGGGGGGVTVIDTERDVVIKELPVRVDEGTGLGMATPTQLYIVGLYVVDTTTDKVIVDPYDFTVRNPAIGSFDALVGAWSR